MLTHHGAGGARHRSPRLTQTPSPQPHDVLGGTAILRSGVPDPVAAALALDQPPQPMIDPPVYELVRALDPLGVDVFMARLPGYLGARRLDPILGRLAKVVAGFPGGALRDPAACYAGLRDLDFMLSAAHAVEALSYKRVVGLEALLLALGEAVGRPPRGCNFTYGLFNPDGPRMRTFSGTDEERLFIHAIQAGTRELDLALLWMRQLAHCRVDSELFVAAAAGLSGCFDQMLAAARYMRASVPPEVFSGQIVCYMRPLDIAGSTYPPVTGAQVQNVGLDYLFFGAGISDAEYVAYVAANLAAMLPFHKRVIRDALTALGGATVLARIGHDLTQADIDCGRARQSLEQLDRYVSAVLSFRAAHLRLARENIPLRPSGQGSGGYDLGLLDYLIERTREARATIRQLRLRLDR